MKEEKFKDVEITTLSEVPPEERKNWIDVALIQAGIMICVPSMMLGGILADSMSMSNAILSGVVGYFITIVLFSIMGIEGSDLGVPTCVVAFSGFGKNGSRFIVSGLFMISMIGWFAIQTSVCGTAFSNLMSEFFHFKVPVVISMVVWGLIMLITAVYGINALDKLNKLAVPALLAVTIIGCIMSVKMYGTTNLYKEVSEPSMTFIGGIILTVSFMSAGALTAPDITRYQKTRKDTILSSSIGVMPAGMLMLIMGAVMTRIASEYDITLVFSKIGIPFIGLLVLIMATWTTNTTNAYCAGIDAVMFFKLADRKRAMATMIAGVFGTLLAAIGIANHFESFLYFLGNIFMPMMGVLIADYWVIRKGKPELWKYVEGWNWAGIIAWISGAALTSLVTKGIPFVQGMILSFLVYLILYKVFYKNK